MVTNNGIQTYVCWKRYIDRTYDLRPVYTGNYIADGKKQCQMEGGKTLEIVGELESPSDCSGKTHAVESLRVYPQL